MYFAPTKEVYPEPGQERILTLYDLRDPEVCGSLHRARAAWAESSDIEALDADHVVLVIYVGGARRIRP